MNQLAEPDKEKRNEDDEQPPTRADSTNDGVVLDEIPEQLETLNLNADIEQQLNNVTESLKEVGARQFEELHSAIRADSEKVPVDIIGYLDEFSRALAPEIRLHLTEVGSLHAQKRSLQLELGELLRMLTYYGPDGEFEPEWMPPTVGPLAPQRGVTEEKKKKRKRKMGTLVQKSPSDKGAAPSSAQPPIPTPIKSGWKRVDWGLGKPRPTAAPEMQGTTSQATREATALQAPNEPPPNTPQHTLPESRGGLFGGHVINSSQYPRIRPETVDQKP
ncbi:hypothetical protein BD410DRAFT_778885 [Rickenella mellea]|uniref:Uncharacterized protein n=1 Tax=Rickenella mellea TaxID=50990 RepID=A0A4Y7PGA7_9AGAM|nr:hypothetical protein BD410DRAFT_778885 [Rickenella mellea]